MLSKLKPYAKAVAAFAGALATVAQTALPLTTDEHGLTVIIITVLTAAGVYQVPNAPLPTPPAKPAA